MKIKQLIAMVVVLVSTASFMYAKQPARNDELRPIVAMGAGGPCGRSECDQMEACSDEKGDNGCQAGCNGYIQISDIQLNHYAFGNAGTGYQDDKMVFGCLMSQQYDCFIEGGWGSSTCSSVPVGGLMPHGYYSVCFDCRYP